MVDGFMMLAIAGIADGTEWLMTFTVAIPIIGVGGPVVAWIVSFTVSAILLIWFIMKGVSPNYLLFGSAVDMIPFINMFPAKTAAVIATIVKERGVLPTKMTLLKTKDEQPQQKEELKKAA